MDNTNSETTTLNKGDLFLGYHIVYSKYPLTSPKWTAPVRQDIVAFTSPWNQFFVKKGTQVQGVPHDMKNGTPVTIIFDRRMVYQGGAGKRKSLRNRKNNKSRKSNRRKSNRRR